jgi:hypothetical protein
MPPAGFEPTISAGERPQNHAIDRGQWDRQDGRTAATRNLEQVFCQIPNYHIKIVFEDFYEKLRIEDIFGPTIGNKFCLKTIKLIVVI